MSHRIIGTAGHIDHGKSALVKALTGTDPDRLAEEKARGITIELGFADLDLGEGRIASLVDVPGHEKFVRHMVAGASGLDAVILVIAADQGVQPQTLEHLDICRLLRIEQGIVAFSKADLIDSDLRELVELEVSELLQGTFLEDAPSVFVSANTGEGIPQLKEQLGKLWEQTPKQRKTGVPRLPVDRSFVLKGFGTVVTGSLGGGELNEGDEVILQPTGVTAKVRGLQNHHHATKQVDPGQRVAVNLQGVSIAEAPRGSVVTVPGVIKPTKRFWGSVTWLKHAPEKLRLGGPVTLHHGTAETPARVRVRTTELEGTDAGVEVFTAYPLSVIPGDSFILRRPAPLNTVGGGVVLDSIPPRRKPNLADFLALSKPTTEDQLLYRIARAGFEGASVQMLSSALGLPITALDSGLKKISKQVEQIGDRWFAKVHWETLVEQVVQTLETFHQKDPLKPGMPREQLKPVAPNWPAEAWRPFLTREANRKTWTMTEDGQLALPTHRVVLDSESEALEAELLATLEAAGLDPPATKDLESIGDRALTLPLLERARAAGRVDRLPDGRWIATNPVHALLTKLRAFKETEGDLMALQAFKTLANVSRKNAIPLLEMFDEKRWTRREGNARRIRVDEFPANTK